MLKRNVALVGRLKRVEAGLEISREWTWREGARASVNRISGFEPSSGPHNEFGLTVLDCMQDVAHTALARAL